MIDYSLTGVGVTLQQTRKDKRRFKANHALISQAWKENWVSKDKKLKSQSITYEHEQNLGPVEVTLIGNNLMFNLSHFADFYGYCPLTYMQLFGYAFGFLVDNHFIVPPDAKPGDDGGALLFKCEKTGKRYMDNADVGILELVDQGRVTTVLDFFLPVTESPIAAAKAFDAAGYAIEARVTSDSRQHFRIKVRSKGSLMLDALEGLNHNDYFRALSKKSDGKFLILGKKLDRFIWNNCKGNGIRPIDYIPRSYRRYETFSECFRMMFPLTRIEEKPNQRTAVLSEGDFNGND